MSVTELLTLADQAASFGDVTLETSIPSVQARTIILSMMESDLKTLSKVKEANISSLGITMKELKSTLDKVKDLKLEDWNKLKKIRERVQEYKKELADKIPHLTDEQLVEIERQKHINKRYNTRDKWLPLH